MQVYLYASKSSDIGCIPKSVVDAAKDVLPTTKVWVAILRDANYVTEVSSEDNRTSG
jgi:hypothetical protein